MATEQMDRAEQEMNLATVCRAVADASPLPMAGLGGPYTLCATLTWPFACSPESRRTNLSVLLSAG